MAIRVLTLYYSRANRVRAVVTIAALAKSILRATKLLPNCYQTAPSVPKFVL